MPYVNNNGIRIHYEVEGEGPPLVLHHGFTTSPEDWREFGYVDSLKNGYQLILMDARGHGASDKPHHPDAYTMEHRVTDIVTVLDDLDISSAHFFGYSYGGRAGLEFAKLAPERAKSLIIGGSDAKARNPDDPNSVRQRQLLEAGLERLIAALEQSVPVSGGWRARLLANDVEALIAITKAPRPTLEDDLPGMAMPFLIYVGESDARHTELRTYAKRLPDASFFSLPGLDHLQGFTRSDLVLPRIKEFLSEVSHA